MMTCAESDILSVKNGQFDAATSRPPDQHRLWGMLSFLSFAQNGRQGQARSQGYSEQRDNPKYICSKLYANKAEIRSVS